MAQAGCLPIPEIQYLAYLHNAIDQIRGEAASLQFFSTGASHRDIKDAQFPSYANPMVVRIAGLAYQKGFGGHFHNDNSVGALLEIPGIILGVPARADDAVLMLRAMTAAAHEHGMVNVCLEPIALYMQKDLHEPGDGEWQFDYPAPPRGHGRRRRSRLRRGRRRRADDRDLRQRSVDEPARAAATAAGGHQGARVRSALAAAAADRGRSRSTCVRRSGASSSTSAAARTPARAR